MAAPSSSRCPKGILLMDLRRPVTRHRRAACAMHAPPRYSPKIILSLCLWSSSWTLKPTTPLAATFGSSRTKWHCVNCPCRRCLAPQFAVLPSSLCRWFSQNRCLPLGSTIYLAPCLGAESKLRSQLATTS